MADKNLEREAREAILRHWAELEGYIERDPDFKRTLRPYEIKDDAPF